MDINKLINDLQFLGSVYINHARGKSFTPLSALSVPAEQVDAACRGHLALKRKDPINKTTVSLFSNQRPQILDQHK